MDGIKGAGVWGGGGGGAHPCPDLQSGGVGIMESMEMIKIDDAGRHEWPSQRRRFGGQRPPICKQHDLHNPHLLITN